MVYHTDNCGENIYSEKLGGIVEGKAVSGSSYSFLNDSYSEFNIWDVFIFTCDIDPESPWHVLVDHSLYWGKFSIFVESFDVEPTLHVIDVYIFEDLKYGLHFSVGDMVDSCKAYIPA